MGLLAKKLDDDRAARNAARSSFDLGLAQVRKDIEARGIGGRIADRVGEDSLAMLDEAIDIADRHRGAIAGTIAAVAIWIFRNPIIAAIEGLVDTIHEKGSRP